MAPPKKIVKQQQAILIDFLEKNIEMAKGIPVSSPVTSQGMKEKWITLARKLNAVEGGDRKPAQGWKRYWFTWRHRCSKKAENVCKVKAMSPGDLNRFLPLDELEVRVLQLNQGRKSSSVPKIEFIKQDSSSDQEAEQGEQTQDVESHFPVRLKIKETKPKRLITDYNTKVNSSGASSPPPPQWALDLEERRIAAEERMAEALETIATTMRVQEERRSMLDERIADALGAIAGTLQEIHSSSQHKNPVNHIDIPEQESAMKNVIFL